MLRSQSAKKREHRCRSSSGLLRGVTVQQVATGSALQPGCVSGDFMELGEAMTVAQGTWPYFGVNGCRPTEIFSYNR